MNLKPDTQSSEVAHNLTQHAVTAEWLASIGCSSITSLIGYSYGDLFFYDPKHLAVQSTVRAMVEFSASTLEPEHAQRLAAIFEEFTDFMGAIHPWLVQEIGHLYLKCSVYEKAEKWLELAVRLEHRWLAVTRTFIDRTPSRREDAAPQDRSLPHARPASALGDVTSNRHTVTGLLPPVNDLDLWDFPQMAEAAIPQVYSFKHALAGQSLVEGRLHRATLDERWLDLPGSGDLFILGAHTLLLHDGLNNRPELTANVGFYWEGYVLGRWDLAIGAFDSTSTRNRGIGQASLSRVLLQVERMLENPESVKWFSAEIHRYYLSNSARIIRSFANR